MTFLFSARQYLLDALDPEAFAEIHVNDGSATASCCSRDRLAHPRRSAARPFALAGLDPDAIYETRRLITPETVPAILNRAAATPFMRGSTVNLSGQALMLNGLPLPNQFPCSMFVVEGHSVAGGRHADL